MPMSPQVRYDVEDHVATVTLDRPDQLNAFTAQMVQEWLDIFDRIDADDDVRAVIVTGSGRAFCAGADLSRRGAEPPAPMPFQSRTGPPRDNGGFVTLRAYDCRKPVIAAINGAAVGIGLTMTLPMDIRIVADDAKLGLVFGARGIVLDGGSSWFLPRVVGINQALEWCLTGRVFGPQEALAAGLVRSVHPAAEVLPVARRIAGEIAASVAPVSAVLIRQLLWRMLGEARPYEAHLLESRGNAQLRRTADAAEGVRSFMERRAPHWTMKPSEDLPGWYPWWPTEQR